jgi:hypothetical protein
MLQPTIWQIREHNCLDCVEMRMDGDTEVVGVSSERARDD